MDNEAAQKKTDKKEETVSRTAVYYVLQNKYYRSIKLCWRIYPVWPQVEAKKSEVKDLTNEEDDDDDDDDEDMVVRGKIFCSH